jgi:hypothetical protein
MSKLAYASWTSSFSSSASMRRSSLRAADSSSTATLVLGIIVSSADWTAKPPSATVSRTAARSSGADVTA